MNEEKQQEYQKEQDELSYQKEEQQNLNEEKKREGHYQEKYREQTKEKPIQYAFKTLVKKKQNDVHRAYHSSDNKLFEHEDQTDYIL